MIQQREGTISEEAIFHMFIEVSLASFTYLSRSLHFTFYCPSNLYPKITGVADAEPVSA